MLSLNPTSILGYLSSFRWFWSFLTELMMVLVDFLKPPSFWWKVGSQISNNIINFIINFRLFWKEQLDKEITMDLE